MIEIHKLDWKEFNKILESGTDDELVQFLENNQLEIKDGKIFSKSKQAVEAAEEYWDKLQLVRKISLNSAYGSLLNAGCRFFDKRIGQSTTLSGRQIVKHMSAEVNRIITGVKDYQGASVIYNDTDSIYFTAYPSLVNEIDNGSIPWNKDTVVQLYDQIGDEVNGTFPEFMLLAFHCPKTRGEVIKAGRELVGTESLFITKKRYAVMYYDKDGKRCDTDGKPGKVKAMGLDLKRSDTPEFMQQFLSKLLNMVLTGASEVEVLDSIKEFRKEFKARPGWEKGSPKRANSITAYMKKLEENPKTTVPGHVRASINWNTLRRMYSDKYSSAITDGAKVIVCKLKPNPLGFTSVAFPVDEPRLPQWFKDLPFDHDEMENVIINNKLDNLIGVLNYDLESTLESNTFNSLFDF